MLPAIVLGTSHSCDCTACSIWNDDVLQQEYVKTAYAKGLNSYVVFGHALRTP